MSFEISNRKEGNTWLFAHYCPLSEHTPSCFKFLVNSVPLATIFKGVMAFYSKGHT